MADIQNVRQAQRRRASPCDIARRSLKSIAAPSKRRRSRPDQEIQMDAEVDEDFVVEAVKGACIRLASRYPIVSAYEFGLPRILNGAAVR